MRLWYVTWLGEPIYGLRAKEVIAIQVSRGRGLGECMKFMEAVKDTCTNIY
ncbi:MAG: hypothetical protein QXU87_09790 [Candidatus Caldarchaeum sp.]